VLPAIVAKHPFLMVEHLGIGIGGTLVVDGGKEKLANAEEGLAKAKAAGNADGARDAKRAHRVTRAFLALQDDD
jgi:hypothetical protein